MFDFSKIGQFLNQQSLGTKAVAVIVGAVFVFWAVISVVGGWGDFSSAVEEIANNDPQPTQPPPTQPPPTQPPPTKNTVVDNSVSQTVIITGGNNVEVQQAGRDIINQTVVDAPVPTETPIPTITPFPTITPLPFSPEGTDERLIVVVKFSRTDGVPDTNVHAEIRDAIELQAKQNNISNIRVEIAPDEINPLSRIEEAKKEAQAIGELYNASIVVWGLDTGIRTRVSFLSLKSNREEFASYMGTLYQLLDSTEGAQFTSPQNYSEFVLNEVPSGINYLALYTLGVNAHLDSYFDKSESVLLLTGAIEEAYQSDLDLIAYQVDMAHVTLGLALFSDDRELATENYEKAVEINSKNIMAHISLGLTAILNRDFDEADAEMNQLNTFYLEGEFSGQDQVAYLAVLLINTLVYTSLEENERAIDASTRAIALLEDENSFMHDGEIMLPEEGRETLLTNFNNALAVLLEAEE